MKCLFILLFSFQAEAANLNCVIQDAFQDVYKGQVQISADKQVSVFKHNGFEYKLRNLNTSEYEIEVFDSATPARSYARAGLKKSGDKVAWSLWTREEVLDMNCMLVDHE